MGAILSVLCVGALFGAAVADPLAHVRPLIGSKNGGNVFAGATLPYGLAKAVADVDGENTGGFAMDGSKVTGFSSVHDSGTGGNPSMGNFPLFPQFCTHDDLNECKFLIDERKINYKMYFTKAEPGMFSIRLENDIEANMTVSQHAALYRFRFPKKSAIAMRSVRPMVLLDLTDLWKSRQNATVSVDPTTARMVGNGTFLPSFGAGTYTMHFCVDFSGAELHETGVWVNSRASPDVKELFVVRGFNNFYIQGGAFARFVPHDEVVTARVGISFKSAEQACRSAETEIPDMNNGFEKLVAHARDEWRKKLKPISITPGLRPNIDLIRSFWSGVYRTMISPQNYTGENPHWDTGRPYFDSFYCIWDSFRTQHPFLTLIDPQAQTQMVQSLLDMYKYEGWLPDCHMSMCKGWTQGGSNADVVLADAYVKNLSSTIDWPLALEAMKKDAEEEPLEWSQHGRGNVASWKELGYVPYLDFDSSGFGTNSRSISRTLEYSYNDFAIATVAEGLGEPKEVSQAYRASSMNWRRLWKSTARARLRRSQPTFLGFPQPRFQNWTWGFQDPFECATTSDTHCSLTSNPRETFEGSIWQYHFYVPHAMSTLISYIGGDEAFIDRLNYFHTKGLTDLSNEPVFLTIFLYHYAGRPSLSAQRVMSYMPQFSAKPEGLPGNDDSGAMGSFLVFCTMGFFPVAGQDVYLITPPLFEEVRIRSPVTGKTATIRNVDFDPKLKNRFVQSATLNGAQYNRAWVPHAFFTEGWTLELRLGEMETEWGYAPRDRPPSWNVAE